MTPEEKIAVRSMRLSGISYAQIADKLNIPEGTIKTFCRRNNLRSADIRINVNMKEGICKRCGKSLNSLPKRKPKQFCSDTCRLTWWNANRDKVNTTNAIKLICHACGDLFESYDAGRKYCCHACYISKRFGKARERYDSRAV